MRSMASAGRPPTSRQCSSGFCTRTSRTSTDAGMAAKSDQTQRAFASSTVTRATVNASAALLASQCMPPLACRLLIAQRDRTGTPAPSPALRHGVSCGEVWMPEARDAASDGSPTPPSDAPTGASTSVVLLRPLPLPPNRSMERYADEIQQGFQDRAGWEVSSASTGRASALASRFRLQRLERAVARVWSYPRLVRRLPADVFHIVDHSYAELLGALPQSRTVVTCHDLMLLRAEVSDIGFRGRRPTVRRFRRRVEHLRRAARVVCVSATTARDVRELLGVEEERLRVIPNGISAAFYPLPAERVQAARTEALGGHRHSLLHVSTGDPYKNVETTLHVLARLRAQGLDVCLLRVGVALTDAQRALSRELRVDPAVIEQGRVDDARLVELYNLADVLIFPSTYEGFGWPPLEAMACGTPVVTSDCDALAEVVGDAGLMAAPRDVEGLAAAVERLLTDDAVAAEYRRRGVARAAEFTWARTIEGLAEVYREVAGAGPPHLGVAGGAPTLL
ncbi:MAG: glycosyltransferase [Dehalococcoidia bacterium]|nr:glycosyltransferase [Dehalococcoidia bacterium]